MPTQRWSAASLGAPELQPCFDAAKRSHSVAWTCTADGLTTREQTGKKVMTFTAVRPAGSDVVQPQTEPDPDTWCEYQSVCSTTDGPYKSYTKGNAAYGDETGAIGNWDNYIRVNLNGRQPQYRLTDVWDRGPQLTLYLTLTCNETPWPYSQCGYSTRNASISSSSWRYQSGYIYGDRLEDATSYRGTVGGTFNAAGHWQTWGIAALRTPIWKCPSGANCTF